MSEHATRIKICGITNLEDARAAINYGADALGFIFVPESPRYVGNRLDVRQLLKELPPFVSRIAVCRTPTQISSNLETYFDGVQAYEQHWYATNVQHKRRIHAFRIKDASSLEEIAAVVNSVSVDALHLDTYHQDKLGGSGETFDWGLARATKERFCLPLILAGGLTPENVAEAIAAVRPYAVDVSSGVEAEPGRKDHAKLRAFIQAVRTT